MGLKKLYPKFYYIYHAQLARCYRKSSPAYKNYGAKGITVNYSIDTFIDWCKCQKWPKGKYQGCVGRIDHNSHYTIDNIRVETRSESTREVNNRRGIPYGTRKVYAIFWPTKQIANTFNSVLDAAKAFQIEPSRITDYCRGKFVKTRGGITFRYASERQWKRKKC